MLKPLKQEHGLVFTAEVDTRVFRPPAQTPRPPAAMRPRNARAEAMTSFSSGPCHCRRSNVRYRKWRMAAVRLEAGWAFALPWRLLEAALPRLRLPQWASE